VTTPKLAVATDRGRFYTDPNPAYDGASYPSVTNVLSTGVSKPVLVPWATKITAERAMETVGTLMKASRDPKQREAAIKDLKAHVRHVSESAAELGSHIHDAAEKHNLGLPMGEDADVEAFALQYLAWLDSWGVDLSTDLEAAEASVVHRDAGYAGTFDVLIWLRSGVKRARELWLIDFKTSSTRAADSVFPEHVMQLAALRHAQTVWLPHGLEAPMPMADRCAVLNLRRGDHALMEVPADRDAFDGFLGALATTKYLHSLDIKTAVRAVPAPGLAIAQRKEAA